jgi:hypothetical protein
MASRTSGSAAAARTTSRACAGAPAKSTQQDRESRAKRVNGWCAARRAGLQTLIQFLNERIAKLRLQPQKIVEMHIKRALGEPSFLHYRLNRHRRRGRRGVA